MSTLICDLFSELLLQNLNQHLLFNEIQEFNSAVGSIDLQHKHVHWYLLFLIFPLSWLQQAAPLWWTLWKLLKIQWKHATKCTASFRASFAKSKRDLKIPNLQVSQLISSNWDIKYIGVFTNQRFSRARRYDIIILMMWFYTFLKYCKFCKQLYNMDWLHYYLEWQLADTQNTLLYWL